MTTQEKGFQRAIGVRQMRLLALGSTIGVGLFLGSASAIKLAGPSILIGYAVAGLVAFLVLRALGEMAMHSPVTGSFAQYATTYVSPFLGYLVGWGYWLYWSIIAIAEVTAVGIYMEFWFPGSPQWVWAFLSIVVMGSINLTAAKVFGEFEFWFALIKVATILLMIAVGTFVILFGFPGVWEPAGLSNLTSHGGFMPNGVSGLVLAMQMVIYAYVGVEMIGIAAGEAKSPETTIPMAIDSFVWRIILFYVGALLVILSIFPWNEIGVNGSPFVQVFEGMGLRTAAGLINFVVITAALSSCNGGIFSSGRILHTLAKNSHAPALFGHLSESGVPARAMYITIAFLFIGVLINFVTPSQAFEYLTSAVTFIGILVWIAILYTHWCFRKAQAAAGQPLPTWRMPWWPASGIFAALFLAGVVGILISAEATRATVGVGVVLLTILSVGYPLTRRALSLEHP
jgi:AAT family amino acid transporter